ncbi:hypothetical protein GOBAR_DD34018 [Gossypium barbadense]|nr:hypothetical protein GOBAR_DD34018 [Gossypium barbadense]
MMNLLMESSMLRSPSNSREKRRSDRMGRSPVLRSRWSVRCGNLQFLTEVLQSSDDSERARFRFWKDGHLKKNHIACPLEERRDKSNQNRLR